MSKKFELILKIAAFILIVVLFVRFLIPLLSSPEIQSIAETNKFYGALIIIGFTALSHIFAPIAGSPAVFMGVAVYGVFVTMIYLYIASLISAVINFWISRKFGRNIVKKFVGEQNMKEVDGFVSISGTELLIISRLIGFPVFELISYAFGLTAISFKKYFIVTAAISIIPNILAGLLFNNLDLTSYKDAFIWFGSLAIIAIIFSLFIKKRYSDYEKSQSE